MARETRIVKDGNSWAVRLPKDVLALSGLKGGEKINLVIRPGRIIIYSDRRAFYKDRFLRSRRDAKQVIDKAFDDVWFDLFGIDE